MTTEQDVLIAAAGVSLHDLDERVSKLEAHVGELRWHARVTNERLTHLETQDRDAESKGYEELRRIIKVVGLTPIIRDMMLRGRRVFGEPGDWDDACNELYRRYGHLQFDGKPLWADPPAVSETTKQLIAESLQHDHEA